MPPIPLSPRPGNPLVLDAVPLWPAGPVVHIGTLDAAHKGAQGESHEGTGLSVSCHPEEWEAIARLGGNPWWQADASALRLVDGHAFVRSHGHALARWGCEQGLVEEGMCHAVRWFDDEFEQEMEMLCATASEAQEEAAERDATIEPRPAWLPTAVLLREMGHDPRRASQPTPDILDALATVWAEREGLDGMWWEDDFNPECLSAPRGVVFRPAVSKLDFSLIRPSAPARPRP